MTTYAALLRAINVTGRNKILMPQLRELLERLGYVNVETYIQSGNAVLSTARSARAVEQAIEDAIARDFGQNITVVLRSAKELAGTVAANPFLARKNVDRKHLHATLLASAPSKARVRELTLLVTADELVVAGRTVYVHTPGGYGRTKLNNTFVERQLGVRATTRNWNTMEKMLELASMRPR